jgi:hypothetical protein
VPVDHLFVAQGLYRFEDAHLILSPGTHGAECTRTPFGGKVPTGPSVPRPPTLS